MTTAATLMGWMTIPRSRLPLPANTSSRPIWGSSLGPRRLNNRNARSQAGARPTAPGVAVDLVYVDQGLTGTNRDRPGLREALAACREGDTLVVTKLDRRARSLPDARAIADELTVRQVRLNLGGSVYDPTDPVGRLLFNVLAMVASPSHRTFLIGCVGCAFLSGQGSPNDTSSKPMRFALTSSCLGIAWDGLAVNLWPQLTLARRDSAPLLSDR
jgi:hypothetical protein